MNLKKEYNIITLCGSVRFEKEFMKIKERLTLERNIVLMPNFFNDINLEITPDIKAMIGEMHRQKIDMSNEVFVINIDGYIGETTKSEIEYARKKKKKIYYLEEKK